MSFIRYRPAIDGLRALAILSVFIFHLNEKWLPGGFVGVDVFFVISGFLITSIIASECGSESFSLKRFYQRRIARIFPAFFVVALTTLAGAAWIYLSQDYATAGFDLAAAALGLSNMKSMLRDSYFNASVDAFPYLHYWSLAVEEQFYVFYPLLVAALFKWRPRKVVPVLSGLALGSFALCVGLTWMQPTWAFYLLPTRAWELLAGCLLSLVLNRTGFSATPWAARAPALGLLLILVSFVIVPEGKFFPGAWALLPVLGAVGVLAGSESSRVEKLLASPFLVKIGKISYSLYLWHWPVFSMVDYKLFLADEWLRLVLKVSISITLALLSYFFIENPLRNLLNQRKHAAAAYVGALTIALSTVCLGLYIRCDNYLNVTKLRGSRGGLIYSPKGATQTVQLMGDSFGSMYGTTVREITEKHGKRLALTSVAGEDPLPAAAPGKNETWWKEAVMVAKEQRPDVIILACRWNVRLRDGTDRIEAAIRELTSLSKHVIIFTQIPSVPKSANRESFRQGLREPIFEADVEHAERTQANAQIMRMGSSKVTIVNLHSDLEKADGSVRFFDDQNRQIFHDDSHVSSFGAEIAKAKIEQALMAAFEDASKP